MAKLNAQDATAKWVSNLSNATAAITRGVGSVTVAPGQAAANAATLWLQRIQQSQDKWKKNVSAVTLQDWQQAMNSYGIPRIAQGAQAKQGKYQKFAESFYPYLQTGMDKVKAMPKGDINASIARANAMIMHNQAFKGKN